MTSTTMTNNNSNEVIGKQLQEINWTCEKSDSTEKLMEKKKLKGQTPKKGHIAIQRRNI